MGVSTHHIRQMLTEAIELAEKCEHGHFTEERTPAALERAENLAAHAAQELRDEMLRIRDGWPVV